MMSGGVLLWWSLLCAVAALNILAWSFSAAMLKRRQGTLSNEIRLQLLLSAVYVFGCAFRSVVPVFDIPRIVLFDTWFSSVIVGRSVATIAELSFVGQWALLLHMSARITGSVAAKFVSWTVVPLIVVAEICSWTAVLTTSNMGHVFENSLWGISVSLLVVSMIDIWPRCPPSWRPALIAGCIAAVIYVAYMFLIDVPMYWSRWLADEASGRAYLTLFKGLMDVAERRVVSHSWEDWKNEVDWMTLYFSVAVWISIALSIFANAIRIRGERAT